MMTTEIAAEILKSQINLGMRKELYYFRDQQVSRWTSWYRGRLPDYGCSKTALVFV